MRRHITWLVAATTSAVVVAFVIPLCALVANLAVDRGTSRARDQAQSVAALVGSISDDSALRRAVSSLATEGPSVVVVDPDGGRIGAPDRLADDTAAAVARATNGLEAFTVRADHGVDALVPVSTGGDTRVVVATVPDAELREGVLAAWATIIGLGVVLIALAALIARELGRRVSTPVTELGDVAHRLREGDLSARASLSGPTETVEVGQALNRLAERIDGLLVAERETVADLGHRLRTPVTALRLDTDLIADPEIADRVRSHVDHLQRSIDTVVRDARRSVREDLPQPADLASLVRERTEFWRALADDQGRQVALEMARPDAGPLLVNLSDGDIRECLDILFDNVFAHTPEQAQVRVCVTGEPSRCAVEVSDAGPGLPPDYRGRGDSGSGSTGLGLDIVRRIAQSAGGDLVLGRSDLGGLSAQITLPRAR